MRIFENIRCHFRNAAKFARERPFSACTIAEDAAEHARLRGHAGNLFNFGFAVDSKEANAEHERSFDIALFLDRIAEGDAISRCASSKRHFDFGDRGRIEAGAERGEQTKNCRIGIGLYGIEHARIRQRPRKRIVIVADDIKINNNARTVLTSGAQKFTNTCGHGTNSPCAKRRALQVPDSPD